MAIVFEQQHQQRKSNLTRYSGGSGQLAGRPLYLQSIWWPKCTKCNSHKREEWEAEKTNFSRLVAVEPSFCLFLIWCECNTRRLNLKQVRSFCCPRRCMAPRSELEGVVVLTEQILGTAASKGSVPTLHCLIFIHQGLLTLQVLFVHDPKPSPLLWWTSAVGRSNVVGLSLQGWWFDCSVAEHISIQNYFPSVTSKVFKHVKSHFQIVFSSYLPLDRQISSTKLEKDCYVQEPM